MVKRHFILFALAFAAALSGVAKTFDVDISSGRPAASNEAYYHGETIEFRAVRGRSVVTNVEYSCVYYQTNGMDSAWWHTDGLVFHPTNDVGAASYRFFLEGRDDLGRDWHANGLLRLLPSPGFTPNEIPAPVHCIDFANIEVANAPWPAEIESATASLSSLVSRASQSATNYTDVVARMPKAFTVAGGPTYPYSGDSTFPMGYYYRVNTGDGKLGYAAKIPAPVGNIVVTGGADDPMIARFGSSFHVDSTSTTLTGVSGYVEDGCYSVADFTHGLWGNSGITVYLHSNILAGSAELSNVTGYYTFDFETTDGKTHYIYFWNEWTAVAEGYSTTYSHEWYDPNEGYWDWEERTLTVGYETTAATDYEYAMFGGTEIATMDAIDTARSQLRARQGRYGELGTGWGYKVYDFTNDERYWELKVPRLTVVVSDQTRPDNRHAIDDCTQTIPTSGLPPDALDAAQNVLYWTAQWRYLPSNYKAFIKNVSSTEDKYSTDGCRAVNYRLGFLPKEIGAEEFEAASDFGVTLAATNVAISTSGQPYLWGGIEFKNLFGTYVKDFSLNWSTNSVLYDNGYWSEDWRYFACTVGGITYTNFVPLTLSYSLSHFRPSVTFNNYVATINVSFDVTLTSECAYLSSSGWKLWNGNYRTTTATGVFTATLRTAPDLETVTEHANHVITDYNQHMIWDDGLKCTWQLCVTNGVFFVRKVSDLDYREKEFIE